MKGRALFLFIAGLSALTLVFCGGRVAGARHNACPLSRIAYVPMAEENDDGEAIIIGHSHINSVPESAKNEPHRFRLRGVQRGFSVAYQTPGPLKTVSVFSASLTESPIYNAPHCVYPQHNYLFRLTPF